MITPVFACDNTGNRIYQIGRVGLDPGGNDTGGAYTGTLRTERISPLGENALLQFRRIACRIWLTGGYTVTMTAFVNGQQTQVYNSSGVLVNQSIVFTSAGPPVGIIPPYEAWIEASINATGTYIEMQLSVSSANVTGIFLPAEAEVHFFPVRTARERVAQSS